MGKVKKKMCARGGAVKKMKKMSKGGAVNKVKKMGNPKVIKGPYS